MDFKVFLSHEALNDLERIVAYIAPHNSAAAERTGNQLLDTAFSLRTFPERGRVVPEFRRPELREIIFRSYRIYRTNMKDHSLEIVRFWHGARGFPHIPGAILSPGLQKMKTKAGSYLPFILSRTIFSLGG